MKNIKVLGIDLAKNVFELHGANLKGKCLLKKRLSRAKLTEFIAKLPPCLIGIEACIGAHYWARLFVSFGHTVKIMAPQFVKPYIVSNKNDRNDARGIAEAVTRENMKFVAIKKIEQQDVLLVHRARELAVKQRIAQANQIRGLLAEYGVVIPQGISHLNKLPEILENNADNLTIQSRQIFMQLYDQFKIYSLQVKTYDKEIERIANQNVMCKEVMKIEGVGPLTASAIIATIGDAKNFKNGREVSAWLGLVPKQHSSGNHIRLSGINKRGSCYVRTLLIHGGRVVVKNSKNKIDERSTRINNQRNRSGYNKTAVAIANKNARVIWALLAKGECYRTPNLPNNISNS